MALKCLVFDCDGVILDSVPVKTRAFALPEITNFIAHK